MTASELRGRILQHLYDVRQEPNPTFRPEDYASLGVPFPEVLRVLEQLMESKLVDGTMPDQGKQEAQAPATSFGRITAAGIAEIEGSPDPPPGISIYESAGQQKVRAARQPKK